MKKIFAITLAVALILALAAVSVYAAGGKNGPENSGYAAACYGYTDADGDGVCDNYGTGCGKACGYTDADSDGVCDNYGTGCAGGGHHGGRGR